MSDIYGVLMTPEGEKPIYKDVTLHPTTISIVSCHIGFAIATIKAFTQEPGVSGEQVREAVERLEMTLEIMQRYERS